MNAKTAKITQQADALLKKDIDLNNAGADKAAKRMLRTVYGSALALLAVILGAAVIIGIGVSFYVVRDVSSGIASIVTPDASARQGRPDRRGPCTRVRRPRSAAMADALQVFKEALIAKKAR